MAKKSNSVRERYAAEASARVAELPIVDENGIIVGWTRTAPEICDSVIVHAEARSLLGPIKPCYVEIEDPVAAARAGAPKGWRGIWRCLAICSESIRVPPLEAGEPIRTYRVRP